MVTSASLPPLPRRAFLGLALRPSKGRPPVERPGLEVAQVVAGSMGEEAGLRAGDRLLAIDGVATEALGDAVREARRAGARAAIELTSTRDGEERRARVRVRPFPLEALEGGRLELGEVRAAGHRLRTLFTFPEGPGPHPAVMLLPGSSCASVDLGASPEAPLRRLVHGWARGGLATARVDKPGVGDSEGPASEALDLELERAGYEAALAALEAHPSVDPRGIFLFGHSVGGMLAPLLGRPDGGRERARGYLVYGSSAERWSRCLLEGQRRQLRLRGVSEARVADHARGLAARLFTEGAFGRSAAYHRQLEGAGVEEAWGALRAPLAVLLGGLDWVVGEEEQRALAAAAEARAPGSGRVIELEGLDHAFTRHPSLEESLARYGQGAFDERLIEESLAWMRAHLARPVP